MIETTAGAVLRAAEFIASVGIFISTAELLRNWRDMRPDGIYAWRVLRSRPMTFRYPRLTRPLDVLLDLPVFPVVLAIRLAAISLLFLPALLRETEIAALAIVVATTFLINYRHVYGNDGSDQMSSLIFGAILLVRIGPGDPRLAAAGAWFLALQSCASYSIAGIAKVRGQKWINGTALFEIFNTESYGLRAAASFLSQHAMVARAMTWSVVAIECTFPLAILGGPKVCLLYLAWGVAFHTANATIMGLNSFLWAFLATYPAIFWCATKTFSLWR
ncbi:MAG TPA: hypothetical protein VH087_13705 [Thermoanaerobaculia bacterium]|nr:hypothetical protein [Thermoanaerobaculia bacterium]